MKSIKNELNFFKVYKLGPGKHADGNMSGVIALILVFLIIVGLGFAVPFTLKKQMQKETASIQDYLNSPEVAELQQKLNIESTKNELLKAYLGNINDAKKSFNESQVFDSELFNILALSMPADVKVVTLNVKPQSIQLSCVCTDRLAPAKFEQALSPYDIFNRITYNGISKGGEGEYSFNMECFFAELETNVTE